MTEDPAYQALHQQIHDLEQRLTALTNDQRSPSDTDHHFRAFVDQNPVSIEIHTPDGIQQHVNHAWEKLWNLRAATTLGKYNVLTDEQALALGAGDAFRRALQGETVTLPDSLYDPARSGFEGRKRWLRTTFFPLRGRQAQVQHVVIMHEDISERVRSEEQYKWVVEHGSEAIFIIQNSRIIFFNARALEWSGYGAAELKNRRFEHFIHPDDRPRMVDIHTRRMQGESPPPINRFRLLTSNGQTRWLQTNTVKIEWHEQPAVLVFAADITRLIEAEEKLKEHHERLEELVSERTRELLDTNTRLTAEINQRQQAEAALLQEKNKVEAILAATGDGMLVIDKNFKVLFQNDPHRRTHGDIVGHICYQIQHNRQTICDECALVNCFADGHIHHKEFSFAGEHGQVHMEVTASPVRDAADNIIAGVEIFRDITETKKLTAQLLQRRKMEAIGTLAGGIAHDFNNILTGIIGHAELALLDLQEQSVKPENLTRIISASKRAAALIQQLLAFSRGSRHEHKPLSLQPVVKEVFRLLRSSLPATIDMQLEIDPFCGTVRGDLSQIQQAIINLANNACHAMEPEGGVLRVALQQVEFVDEITIGDQQVPAGRYARLTITDTGHGMDRDTVSRIFDPYFTNKSYAEGSGLGLATVHGIVRDHEGQITVQSEVDIGSEFSLFLPLSIPAPATDEAVADLPVAHGRVLLVDDEPMVAEVAGKILEHVGCQVTLFLDSAAAWSAFKADPQGFDLVVTDQTMPGLTGFELAGKILALRPGMPIILASGYSEAALQQDDTLTPGIKKILTKPYDFHTLGWAAAKILT